MSVIVDSSNRELCYLCGTNPGTTKDHIFPRSLFPRPLPTDLMTAPACEDCNNSLSDAEEFFRTLVVMAGNAVLTPAGKSLWDQRVRPSLRADRRWFKSHLQQSLTIVDVIDVIDEKGKPIGSYPVMEADREPFDRVVDKIAKGLYYAETQQPLPPCVNIRFKFEQFNPERFFEGELRDAIAGSAKTKFGDGDAVTFWRNTAADDPRQSLTWILFYKVNVMFIVTSTPEFI